MLHMKKEVVPYPSDFYPKSPITNFVSGKRVAIVGGSPKIAGTELGEKIDSYDIVVRVNVHWPCPRRLLGGDGIESSNTDLTRDIGNRTDILFHNGATNGGSFEDLKKLQGLKYVVMLGASNHELIYGPIVAWCEKQRIKCLWFDKYYKHLRYEKGLGGMVALLVFLEAETKEIFVSGYDFYHFEPNYRNVFRSHQPKNDAKIFRERILLDERVIIADHMRGADEGNYSS